MKSYTALKEQFDLPLHQFWRYLQMRHLLDHTCGSTSLKNPDSNTPSSILGLFRKGHVASKYYSMLLNHSDTMSSNLKAS